MVPSAQKISAAGIPLVNISDKLEGGNAVSFVGTDDYGIALDTARTLLKAMGGKGNLVILNGPDSVPTAVARAPHSRPATIRAAHSKQTVLPHPRSEC